MQTEEDNEEKEKKERNRRKDLMYYCGHYPTLTRLSSCYIISLPLSNKGNRTVTSCQFHCSSKHLHA